MLKGKNFLVDREIASLTKIMTFYVLLDFLSRNKLDPKEIVVTVTSSSCQVIGTSACLQTNMQVSVYDLFYALMLPSGNDAAFLIAEYIGALMIRLDSSQPINEVVNSPKLFYKTVMSTLCPIKRFVK